jgi:2-aminoethylphosphonate-pyruvate transaminase
MSDKKLFTPGPLSTSRTVKEAMLRDLGSRDTAFIETVRDIRRRLLRLSGVEPDTYTTVLMQGSGTFRHRIGRSGRCCRATDGYSSS